jgi:hypothetical protein
VNAVYNESLFALSLGKPILIVCFPAMAII